MILSFSFNEVFRTDEYLENIKELKELKFDFSESFDVTDAMNISSCYLEDSHYEKAFEETGVDFRIYDKDLLLKIISEVDYSDFIKSLESAEYLKDYLFNIIYDVSHYTESKVNGIYIGNDSICISVNDLSSLHETEDNDYNNSVKYIVKNRKKLKKIDGTITNEEFLLFDRFYVDIDSRTNKNKKASIKQNITKNGYYKEDVFADFFIDIDESINCDWNNYFDCSEEELIDRTPWKEVLKKLEEISQIKSVA
ncbi:MAG: hypothetical protein ACRC5S_03725 [Cetobacterium sp.]|uniref:hypothetical protein n=1 Tax=Cetobacterium somerae TaxID=188913 RepID=UPI002E7B6C8B|nr:hypothetical protein [Cetobacterium somerae]WVJ03110.1 hypothetical protein VSU16_14395 [Cetobacterium somerae]